LTFHSRRDPSHPLKLRRETGEPKSRPPRQAPPHNLFIPDGHAIPAAGPAPAPTILQGSCLGAPRFCWALILSREPPQRTFGLVTLVRPIPIRRLRPRWAGFVGLTTGKYPSIEPWHVDMDGAPADNRSEVMIQMNQVTLQAGAPAIRVTTSRLTIRNKLDHIQARWRINRAGLIVEPGLYRLGSPGADSHVFISANYTPSFDELRSALSGIDCYILVLDTKGVNVWCAAGKGTFGTDELVSRVETSGLAEVVAHRRLILPQLGAPGVAAHLVKKRSGFRVIYGPVRAKDIPAFLESGEASAEMRRVCFTAGDRFRLVSVEFVGALPYTLAAAILLWLIGGFVAAAAAVVAVLAGTVLFPVLLPWIPTPNFATKGFVLGGTVAAPFILAQLLGDGALLQRCLWALPYLLMMPPTTAFLALNFTGASTFTSRSGVVREIYSYVPVMAWMFGGGLVAGVAFAIIAALGGPL
jgi:hypothetical protein